MKGVLDFPGFSSVLIELIGVDNFYCKSSTDRLKIQTANPESYRLLIRYLKDQKAEYHTFQLKEDKPLRVVIRSLHPSTPTELIKAELETRLYEIRQVTNVMYKINKRPLPLFFIDLEPTDHSNEIYHLSSLLHTKVKIDEPYKPTMVSQYLNCQDYGHWSHAIILWLLSSLCPLWRLTFFFRLHQTKRLSSQMCPLCRQPPSQLPRMQRL